MPLTTGRRAGGKKATPLSLLLSSGAEFTGGVRRQLWLWLVLSTIRLELPGFRQREPEQLGEFQFPWFESCYGNEFTRRSRSGECVRDLFHRVPFHEHDEAGREYLIPATSLYARKVPRI